MDGHTDPLPSVLVADGHRAFAQSLQAVVRSLGDANSEVATSAPEALDLAVRMSPDVAIVDLDLSPGCGLVTGLLSTAPDIRVIVMADKAGDDPALMFKALEAGAVGAIYKEATLDEFRRALLASAGEMPVMPEETSSLLFAAYVDAMREKRKRDLATIEALAGAVEARDAITGAHLHRTTALAQSCLKEIDPILSNNEEITYGYMLHDVGKIGVPDAILNKPGPLDDGEWEVMQRHPELGVRIVQPMGFSPLATDVILSHHERWDGSGYPNRLRREEIPLAARVFSVVDAYDAMTSDRPYRVAMRPADAMGELAQESGRAFDPEIVDLAIDLISNGASNEVP